jgi:hypothetical protein
MMLSKEHTIICQFRNFFETMKVVFSAVALATATSYYFTPCTHTLKKPATKLVVRRV